MYTTTLSLAVGFTASAITLIYVRAMSRRAHQKLSVLVAAVVFIAISLFWGGVFLR